MFKVGRGCSIGWENVKSYCGMGNTKCGCHLSVGMLRLVFRKRCASAETFFPCHCTGILELEQVWESWCGVWLPWEKLSREQHLEWGLTPAPEKAQKYFLGISYFSVKIQTQCQPPFITLFPQENVFLEAVSFFKGYVFVNYLPK